jgi:tRNA modification GTPase
MLAIDHTIAAMASAPGSAARGIVRLSGPDVLDVVLRCFRPDDDTAAVSTIKSPSAIEGRVSAAVIDESTASRRVELPATLLLWPTNRSYTRQPMAEFHTIGSPPLVNWLLQTLCAAGARLAQPGEFTLRAFLAGRIDLTQAEAVLGVIDATDHDQLNSALVQLAGGLSKPLQQLRDDLLNLLADLEAGLDFVEEDIRFVEWRELDTRLTAAAGLLDSLLQQLGKRDHADQSPRAVLVGWPNVGKSSLFNALVQNAVALVSPQAGTTRDYLSAKIYCSGVEIELIDTAGINADSSASAIDHAAQHAAKGQHRHADIRVLCLDATRPTNDWEQRQLAQEKLLVAWTKCDLISQYPTPAQLRNGIGILTSSRRGDGLVELKTAMADTLLMEPGDFHAVAGTAVRARDSIRLAAEAITQARQFAKSNAGEELIAAELRAALEELGKVVGAIYTDDLLDRIFSRFCIGK